MLVNITQIDNQSMRAGFLTTHSSGLLTISLLFKPSLSHFMACKFSFFRSASMIIKKCPSRGTSSTHVLASVSFQNARPSLRPYLHGLGCPRQPSPQVTLVEVTFSLFLCKTNKPFTLGLQTRLGRRDNLGGRVVSPRQVG